MDKIGRLLKAYRLEHELSPDEVAFMLELSVEAYSAMESDQAEVSLKQLLKLCRYYGIKPEVFLKAEDTRDKKAAIHELLADPETFTVPEATIDEADDDDDLIKDFPPRFDLDKSKRSVKARQVIERFKKEGKEVTEAQAEKVLDFLYLLAPLALNITLREAKWEQKLQRHPNGFAVAGKRYPCRLCGHGNDEDQMWYDRFGLKCMACQHAVEQGTIPGKIVSDDTLYYSEFDLRHYFRLEGKALREWIKKGLLKPRIIPKADGKGKHYQVFLTSDHPGFLPPVTMFRIGGLVEDEDENGKKLIRGSEWYEYVDPFEYLKDYGIMKYMQYKTPPADPGDTKTNSDIAT